MLEFVIVAWALSKLQDIIRRMSPSSVIVMGSKCRAIEKPPRKTLVKPQLSTSRPIFPFHVFNDDINRLRLAA